ncbi:hypothetical protein CPB85DRAFT_1251552 [Mucidula mucida]|nr:hypothetical protein CPB85DRAFT_1251552 [Mucidula mucida]
MYSPDTGAYYADKVSVQSEHVYSPWTNSPKSVCSVPSGYHVTPNASYPHHTLSPSAHSASVYHSPASGHASISTATSTTAYSASSWGSTPTLVQASLAPQHHSNARLRLRTLVNFDPSKPNAAPCLSFNLKTKRVVVSSRYPSALDEAVTAPSTATLKIKIDRLFPTFIVSAQRSGKVTLKDICDQLVSFLSVPLSGTDYSSLVPELQRAAGAAFQRRTQGNRSLHDRGMLRVDVLGESVFFVGLRQSAVESDAFETMLTPIRIPALPCNVTVVRLYIDLSLRRGEARNDAAALLLASTLPCTDLLAVQINYPSSYSVLAASSILTYYGHGDVPIGSSSPLNNDSFFDDFYYQFSDYASKVQYHWNHILVDAEGAWDSVTLYRKILSEQDDNSVSIASIGFFDNLSGLLNSTADSYSSLDGYDLVAAKVKKLAIMGGAYPSGWEYNFGGSSPSLTAHVVNTWPGSMTFSGSYLGGNVTSGGRLTVQAPSSDPVSAAYKWYIGYNTPRYSWDPITVMYAVQGLGDLLEYGNFDGYNNVSSDGANAWVNDKFVTNQHWLVLKEGVSNAPWVTDWMTLHLSP